MTREQAIVRMEELRREIARLDEAQRVAISHGANLAFKARKKRRFAQAELAQLMEVFA